MALLRTGLVILAGLVALPIGGGYLLLGIAAWRSAGTGGRSLGSALLGLALLDLGGAALALWRWWTDAGGLLPALAVLVLSGLLARAGAAVAHGVANP